MFNGIIYNTGKVVKLFKSQNSLEIVLNSDIKVFKKEIGSSISCNGTCLTLTKIYKKKLFFYVSIETLKKTNFANIKVNDIINLEKSLKYGQSISGHFTQGHIDTTGQVSDIKIIDKSWIVTIKLQKKYLKNLIEKASICINGVSLTISKVNKNSFIINIIPHTLKMTNLLMITKKSILNIEIDIISKYINKLSN